MGSPLQDIWLRSNNLLRLQLIREHSNQRYLFAIRKHSFIHYLILVPFGHGWKSFHFTSSITKIIIHKYSRSTGQWKQKTFDFEHNWYCDFDAWDVLAQITSQFNRL